LSCFESRSVSTLMKGS